MEKYINKIINADCLDILRQLPDKCIDLVLTDPPYGTTACKWDSVIPFEPMWQELKRIVKDNGAICLFGSEPFSSALRMSNIKMYKYDWIWDKIIPSGFGYAKYRPMQQTENISVFTVGNGKMFYYPQMTKRDKPIKAGGNRVATSIYGGFKCINEGKEYHKIYDKKNPTTRLKVMKIRKGIHPTQKPVELIEYLVKTYTLENEIVLDFCSGSGTTAVACHNLKRRFICIEKDPEYWKASVERLEKVRQQMTLF